MAPTVCSEKKVRVAGMKEARRRINNVGVAQANTSTAAGVTPSSAVLSYVAKGSMNSAGRLQRRRAVRLPPRLQQHAKRVASATSRAGNSQREARTNKQVERMEFNEYNATSTQLACTHSSSSSSIIIGSSSSSSNNIKTVLQPTTANSNSSNCGSNGNNKTTIAKHCDHISSMDEDDEEEDRGDGDSGYEFALEPIKLPEQEQQHQQQYHTHNQGLLSIALKTIKLVQRNKLLQMRLAQLQRETSEFIASVLANPENRHFREKITTKADAANKVSNMLLRH